MRSTEDVEAAVLAAIDDAAMLTELADFVAVASVDGTAAESEAQEWCADRLERLGLTMDRWETPISALVDEPDFPGMEVERTSVTGCVGVLRAHDATGDLPALAVYGHTDVVPPGEVVGWRGADPFAMRVEHDAAWGRGTCDMKGGLVAAMAALEAIFRCEVRLDRPVAVHCVSAEEDGGVGAWDLLRRGHRAAACVSAEPTGGAVVPANAGALTFRLEVPGLATHGSTRTRGVNAIEKFERVHAALRDLEARRNADPPPLFAHLDLAWPLSIGVVSAGDWASTVPDRLVAEGRYGVRIDESIGQAVFDFERAVAEACAADDWLRDAPVVVSWPGGMFAPGGLAADHPLVLEVADSVSAVTGIRPAVLGGPYGSDLRHYVNAGVPTVQYGPGEAQFAHAADEHVLLHDLARCARVYALMILRRCGVR